MNLRQCAITRVAAPIALAARLAAAVWAERWTFRRGRLVENVVVQFAVILVVIVLAAEVLASLLILVVLVIVVIISVVLVF